MPDIIDSYTERFTMTYTVKAQKTSGGAFEAVAVFYNQGPAIIFKNLNAQFYSDIYISVI